MATTEQILDATLTEREQEIMGLITAGLSNRQIADQLYLTLDTVKWYTRQIYQKLDVHSRTQAIATVRALDGQGAIAVSVKHNLPVHRNDFIGREQELADIQARLLDPACRLLTLVGPGGIGKTRLALEVAHQQMHSYPDGVYWVELASVESLSFVMQTVADGLRLTLTNERSAQEQVINYLREKSLLLLLDNFEHLLDAVDLIGEVLARSQAVKVLVTSRERLHLKEEWLFDVEGLRYPTFELPQDGTSQPADYAAGRLFLWTAQRAHADFAPDGHDLAQIARICQLVGGMPLGIELAASWVRLLPCAEIARGIALDLEMLTTSWRDVPARHRSVVAVLEHSWKLLTPSEQTIFSKLTVFSGAFWPEAAVAVADTSLKTLLALVDKSFLRRVDQDRFGIHELVKQYGRSHLQGNPELWAMTRLRHCHYYADFMFEHMSAAVPRSQVGVVEGVFDDLQMAWRYAVENQHLAQIQQFAAGFLVYYRMHSWYRAGSGALAVYQRALTCFDPSTRISDQLATLACLNESLGDLQGLTTAYENALDAYGKALEFSEESNHIERGRLYGKIADTWVVMNQHEKGHEYFALAESELAQAPKRTPAWWRECLRIKTQRMELYYWQSRPDDMDALARQIRPWIEQHGSMMQRVRFVYMLGMMALRRDRYFNSSDAIAYSSEALALSQETGNLGEIAYRHFSHGFSHLWSNHLDEAETHLQIAREMTAQNGDLSLLARALTYLTLVYRKRGDIERVRAFAAESMRIAEETKMLQYTGMAHAQFAWLAWRDGDPVETKRQGQAAIEDWGGLGDALSMAPFRWLALFPLLEIALNEDDVAAALHWARHVITPNQQRLPDALTLSLERGVAAGVNDTRDTVRELLGKAFELAQEFHYV